MYCRGYREASTTVLDSGSVDELDATIGRKQSNDLRKSSFSSDRIR